MNTLRASSLLTVLFVVSSLVFLNTSASAERPTGCLYEAFSLRVPFATRICDIPDTSLNCCLMEDLLVIDRCHLRLSTIIFGLSRRLYSSNPSRNRQSRRNKYLGNHCFLQCHSSSGQGIALYLLLLLAGDVELNPGPVKHPPVR